MFFFFIFPKTRTISKHNLSSWLFPRFAPYKITICSINVVNGLINKFWRFKDFRIFSLFSLFSHFSYSFWQYNLLDSSTTNLFIFLKSKSFLPLFTCYKNLLYLTKKSEPLILLSHSAFSFSINANMLWSLYLPLIVVLLIQT